VRTLKNTKPEEGKPAPRRIVGKVRMVKLERVTPNDWNPNKMTPDMRASLRYGLEHDGWLVSQSLLVWGTDEKGKEQSVIIDGEHRYLVASELGFTTGPMVFLNGITRDEAKLLTVKMNQKHGTFDTDMLGELLRTTKFELDEADFDLGFDKETLGRLLKLPQFEPDETPPPRLDELDEDEKAKWSKLVKCPNCNHEFKS
jgi:ParB-like chromosome segregation protein Spo0J